MPLDFSFKKVKNYEDVCWNQGDDGEQYVSAVTDRLIWGTMKVGIGEITEKNADEFYARMKAYHCLAGFKLDVTIEDVRKHVGLHTNASQRSRTRWSKELMETAMTNFLTEL